MAAGFNRVILMGNLTRDPELRYTPQGTAVADLSIAVNTRAGKKDETLFVDVTVWDRTAENCCEYLSKGRPILVEGRLTQDSWEDRETGQKRSKMRVVANAVQFLGGGEGGGSGGSRGGGSRSQAPRRSAPPAAREEPPFEDDFGGDDIPF